MGFSNPSSKTRNCLREANHHGTSTPCLGPERETSGPERPNPVPNGRSQLSLWRRGCGRRDDDECRNTGRTPGIPRGVSGTAHGKNPRSRISLPWGLNGGDRIRTPRRTPGRNSDSQPRRRRMRRTQCTTPRTGPAASSAHPGLARPARDTEGGHPGDGRELHGPVMEKSGCPRCPWFRGMSFTSLLHLRISLPVIGC